MNDKYGMKEADFSSQYGQIRMYISDYSSDSQYNLVWDGQTKKGDYGINFLDGFGDLSIFKDGEIFIQYTGNVSMGKLHGKGREGMQGKFLMELAQMECGKGMESYKEGTRTSRGNLKTTNFGMDMGEVQEVGFRSKIINGLMDRKY